MSSSAPGGSDNPDKKKGIGKYVTRVKTILSDKRKSISGVSGLSASSDVASPSPAAIPSEPSPAPVAPAPVAEKEATKKPTTTKPAATEASSRHVRSTVPGHTNRDPFNREKAKALFEKYGFELDLNEWPLSSREPQDRVEKPIRMRIHRTCHRCQTTFGVDKTCGNCGHLRCKKCPRYPLKKTAKGKEKEGTTAAAPPTSGPNIKGKRPKYQLTIPSRNGGQDLVRKNITQRIHRKCHRCDTEFAPGDKVCAHCSHTRCKKCPRDPAKLKKYPDGYPGDAEPEPERPARTYRKVRRRVKWSCHSCSTLYMEKNNTCANCGHERCSDCTRDPPKHVKPPPDPEVMKSVAEKLENMRLGTYSSSSAAAARA